MLRLLRPLYANTPSLDTMMKNAIRSDCPDTVNVVKMLYETNQSSPGLLSRLHRALRNWFGPSVVEIARSRAVRRIVQIVDPGHEDDMEQRKAELKEKIERNGDITILGEIHMNC